MVDRRENQRESRCGKQCWHQRTFTQQYQHATLQVCSSQDRRDSQISKREILPPQQCGEETLEFALPYQAAPVKVGGRKIQDVRFDCRLAHGVWRNASSIERADNAAHARSGNGVHRNLRRFQRLQHSDMR
ncbi:MAG: hypothetical protein BWY63_02826 [Chloroflexi bacterium ADurb.Bin360]|nr:MAG: hypothetical protein BWY63_02826 [Chloroflexi bacterium ADurb.Bin360]